MSRELRTLIVLVVALGAAGMASFAVYRAIGRIPVREIEVGKATMVIAAEAMPMGTMVAKDKVKVVKWPSGTPIEGSFTKVEDVIDRGLIADVLANEPLTESKLAPVAAGAGLPPSIPQGMRAISIKVNEVIGVAGFVVPGTRVDVLATVSPDNKDPISRTVVADVQVLTSGTRFDQDKARKDGKPIPATVVTLLLNPQDAEKVTLAAEKGRLMLALRNPLDQQPTITNGVRLAAQIGPTTESKPAPPRPRKIVEAPPPPAPDPIPVVKGPYTVEAIRAAKRSEEVIH